MLLRLTVSNFLSIAQRQELSLVATNLKGPNDPILTATQASNMSVLSSSVIYGANASGKTNFIKAMNFMCQCVNYSHRRSDPNGEINRQPFALDPQLQETPTHVEVDFTHNSIRYNFGFECDNNSFVKEWLYSYPEGKKRKLYLRTKESVDFGTSLKGQKKVISELMRPNSLFLSTAIQNDHDELSSIGTFFSNIIYHNAASVDAAALNLSFEDSKFDDRTVSFLNFIGTGINGFRINDINLPAESIEMREKFRLFISEYIGEHIIKRDDVYMSKDRSIELAHPGKNGDVTYFELKRESSGTRRLISILRSVFKAIDQGSLIIIDEIDASLHTLAAESIFQLFSNRELNSNGSQLLCTTHDTNLLNSSALRRDQVWFCEKDAHGASSIFSLSDIRSRPDDNFQKGYLEGRYGAIPYSGDLRRLLQKV